MPPKSKLIQKVRPMPTWQTHRDAVKGILKRRKKSVYWLAQQLRGEMSRDLIYSYLRGDYGISVKNVDAINRVLGIRFTDE